MKKEKHPLFMEFAKEMDSNIKKDISEEEKTNYVNFNISSEVTFIVPVISFYRPITTIATK